MNLDSWEEHCRKLTSFGKPQRRQCFMQICSFCLSSDNMCYVPTLGSSHDLAYKGIDFGAYPRQTQKSFQRCYYWRQWTTSSLIAGILKLILARDCSAPLPWAPCSCERLIWQRQARPPLPPGTTLPTLHFMQQSCTLEIVLTVFHSGPELQRNCKESWLGNGRKILKVSRITKRKKIEDFDWWLFQFVTIKCRLLWIFVGKMLICTSNSLIKFSLTIYELCLNYLAGDSKLIHNNKCS